MDGLFALVRRAAPFAELPRAPARGRARHARPAAIPPTSSRSCGRASSGTACAAPCARAKARRRLAVTNAGTIPDRGLYGVFLADGGGRSGGRSGRAASAWASSTRRWCSRAARARCSCSAPRAGASSRSTRDRVLVDPAPGEPGKMPFWKGDRPARAGRAGPRASAGSRASSRRRPRETARGGSSSEHDLDARAARRTCSPTSPTRRRPPASCPTTARSCSSARATRWGTGGCACSRPGAGACTRRGRSRCRRSCGHRGDAGAWRRSGATTASWCALPDRERPPDGADAAAATRTRSKTSWCASWRRRALFAAHFREAAARALLLPRRRPGQRSPLWMQRKRAADLLRWPRATARSRSSWRPTASACRTCSTCRPSSSSRARVRRREIRVVTVDTADAVALLRVAALRLRRELPLRRRRAAGRAHAPRPSPSTRPSSASCWARPSCASCSTREALAELELALQALDEAHAGRAARTACTTCCCASATSRSTEIAARASAARGASAPAEAARPGSTRSSRSARDRGAPSPARSAIAAAEDAGRLRDALGTSPPPGLPQAFLEPAPRALRDVVGALRAHARPVPPRARWRAATGSAGARGGAGARRAGRATAACVEGEFRPGGHGREWCERRRADDAAAAVARAPAQAGRARRARGARAAASSTGRAW